MTAWAGTPVVHEVADPAAVVIPWPVDAEPVRFTELTKTAPQLASGEPVRPCAAPGGLGDLPQRLRAAVIRADLAEAETLYAEALDRAPCDPTLTAETLGQVGFLGGLVASSRGDRTEAVARYSRAKAWAAGLDWSDAWPAGMRVHFDEAIRAEGSVGLVVRPAAKVSVDGLPFDGAVRLAPGPHVLRVGDLGAWIELPPVDDALVVPAAFPADAIGWMGSETPARRAELTALLAAGLGEGRRAVITDGTVTWAGTTGRTDWTESGRVASLPLDVPVLPDVPREPTKRSPVGPALMLGGGLVALAGAGLSSQAWLSAEGNRTSNGDWTPDQHASAKTRYKAGWVGAGAGIALAGVGLAVTIGGGSR